MDFHYALCFVQDHFSSLQLSHIMKQLKISSCLSKRSWHISTVFASDYQCAISVLFLHIHISIKGKILRALEIYLAINVHLLRYASDRQ